MFQSHLLRKHRDDAEDKVKNKFLYNCRALLFDNALALQSTTAPAQIPVHASAPVTISEQHSPLEVDDTDNGFLDIEVASPDNADDAGDGFSDDDVSSRENFNRIRSGFLLYKYRMCNLRLPF
jgi:hypothetical protein